MKTFRGLFGIVLIGLIVCDPAQSSTTTNSLILLDQQSGIDFTDSAIELVSRYAGDRISQNPPNQWPLELLTFSNRWPTAGALALSPNG